MNQAKPTSPLSSLRPSFDSRAPPLSPYATSTTFPQHQTFLDLASQSHRRSSSTSFFSNMDLPMGFNRAGDWSHGSLGPNSIADVVAAMMLQKPSTRDIPPVTLAGIKKVGRQELNRYLREITEEYETFYGTLKGQSVQEEASIVTSLDVSAEASISVVDTDLQHDDGIEEEAKIAITPLDTIPKVFFETDFQLDNPRIFDLVSEKSSILRPEEGSGMTSQSKVLASNAILQEKLSWYIDTVELHLIQEISNASSSFFSALDDLRNINKEAADVVSKINSLREDLKVIDEQRAISGIKSLKVKQRRRNVAMLIQCLDQLITIMDKADEAENRYLSEEYEECLGLLDDVESFIAGSITEGTKLWTQGWIFEIRDLRSIKGLSDLRESLRTLRTRVGEGYSKRFTDILVKDLHDHIDSVPSEDSLQRMGKILNLHRKDTGHVASNTSYIEIGPDLRKTLEVNVQGLIKSNDIQGAFKAYRDIITKEAKNVVRMHLPSSSLGNSDTMSMSSNLTGRSNSQDRSASLGNQLRAMSNTEFETMLGNIFASLSETFRRLSTQQKLLLDVTLSSTTDPSQYAAIDLSDLLKTIIESSQKRIVKVVNVRRDSITNFPDIQLLFNFFTLSGIFLSECEAICGEPGSELRSCVTGLVKQCLNNRHREKVNELLNSIEKFNWKEEEISKETQSLVDQIVQTGTSDPDSWLDKLKIVLYPGNHQEPPASSEQDSSKKLPKNVFVDTQSFIIPKAGLAMIRTLHEYVLTLVVLPYSDTVISQVLELLSRYNNKIQQLILGAGATRTAGLRHITAKHLALASQALNIAIAMIDPHVSECAHRHGVPGPIGTEVLKEVRDHVQLIYTKFMSLMSDKMNRHSETIQTKVDWTTPSSTVHKYMLDLVKDTTNLTKILSSILDRSDYLLISSRVFDNYKTKLIEAYTAQHKKLGGNSSIAKQNMKQDVDYFSEKLGSVEGAGNLGVALTAFVNGLEAEEPEQVFDASAALESEKEKEKKDSEQVPQEDSEENNSVEKEADNKEVHKVEHDTNDLQKKDSEVTKSNETESNKDESDKTESGGNDSNEKLSQLESDENSSQKSDSHITSKEDSPPPPPPEKDVPSKS